MSNKKILILEGGNNEEHDVSLVTSREIQIILNKNKLEFKILRVNPKNFHKKIINRPIVAVRDTSQMVDLKLWF